MRAERESEPSEACSGCACDLEIRRRLLLQELLYLDMVALGEFRLSPWWERISAALCVPVYGYVLYKLFIG